MKYTIKNPLNSPYSIAGEDGQIHVPARGEVTAGFTDMQIRAVRAVGYFTVTEVGKRDPLDHDGDGVKGGFVNTSTEPVSETVEIEHVAVEAEPSETPAVEAESAPHVPQAPRRGRPPKNKD